MDGLSFPLERRLPTVVGLSNGIPSFSISSVGDNIGFDDMPKRYEPELDSFVAPFKTYLQKLIDEGRLSTRSPLITNRFNQSLIYT